MSYFKTGAKKALSLLYTERRFELYKQEKLLLPDCKDNSLLEQYQKNNLQKIPRPITAYYQELWEDLSLRIKQKQPFIYVRASDGEAAFLQGKFLGNVGRRHYTARKEIPAAHISLFKQGLLDCNSRHVEMYRNNRGVFKKIFRREIFSEIPFECLYALVAGRQIFKTPWRIGLIGADNKLDIIKQLLGHEEYCQYLGRRGFEDYISVPEIGASNDPLKLAKSIAVKLKNDIDIYLVGIGIAKLVILPELKKASNTVFFDAGAGVSALAGLVSLKRPYFAEWVNFRLKDFDYSKVDIMDADMSVGKILI